jgi:hypothetical protein
VPVGAPSGPPVDCTVDALPAPVERLRLTGGQSAAADPAVPATGGTRSGAHSRDERRLARIDRKVAERDRPQN